MKFFIYKPFYVILFVFCVNIIHAKQPIILQNADSLVGISSDNLNIRNFIGNVSFSQGEITLKCDTAIQYIEQNRVELMGNVIINRNNIEIRSPKIDYIGNEKLAYAYQFVQIRDLPTIIEANSGTYNLETNTVHFNHCVKVENDSLVIFSDELIHNTDSDESFAYGDVKLFGKMKLTAVICDSLVYKPKMDFFLAYSNAGFYYIDTVKNLNELSFDTLSIHSNTIFGNQVKGREFYQFLENVRIIRSSLYSKCNQADFFSSGDSLVLIGEPVVWYDSLQLFADTIVAFFPKQKIEKIELRNNSIAVSTNDTSGIGKIDQISGKDIDILFRQDSIRVIISKSQANSLYFIAGEDGEQSGFQRSGADSIYIYFENNDVENIVWKSNPFMDFYPENIWSENLSEYYLPRFKIRYDRPKKRNFPTKE